MKGMVAPSPASRRVAAAPGRGICGLWAWNQDSNVVLTKSPSTRTRPILSQRGPPGRRVAVPGMESEPPDFAADPWLEQLDRPVLGLNIAFHWPLPEPLRAGYDRLRARLLALDGGVYVY